MWNSEDLKFVAIFLAIGLLLTAGYCAAETLLPWLVSGGVSEAAKIFTAFVLAAAAAAFAGLSFPVAAAWEEGIVGELTMHQDSWIFRASFPIGAILFLAASAAWDFRWPMQAGSIAGGLFVWLYLTDVTVEAVANIDEVLDNISGEWEHAVRLSISAALAVFLGAAVSLLYYRELAIPEPPVVSGEEEMGPVEEFLEGVKAKLPGFAPKANESSLAEVDRVVEEVGGERADKWVRELGEKEQEPKFREFLRKLPASPGPLVEKLRSLAGDADEETRRFLGETLRYLQAQKRGIAGE